MLFREKKRNATPVIALTANGTSGGLLTVASIDGLFAKQKISLFSNTKGPVELEIKAFNDEFSFYVGIPGNINNRYDASAFLVSDNASIQADQQVRPGITLEESSRAVYQEEPAVALRVVPVGSQGNIQSIAAGKLVNAEFDSIQASYPSTTEEEYVYFKGGLSGTQVATVLVTYTSSSKDFIDSVEVTYP